MKVLLLILLLLIPSALLYSFDDPKTLKCSTAMTTMDGASDVPQSFNAVKKSGNFKDALDQLQLLDEICDVVEDCVEDSDWVPEFLDQERKDKHFNQLKNDCEKIKDFMSEYPTCSTKNNKAEGILKCLYDGDSLILQTVPFGESRDDKIMLKCLERMKNADEEEELMNAALKGNDKGKRPKDVLKELEAAVVMCNEDVKCREWFAEKGKFGKDHGKESRERCEKLRNKADKYRSCIRSKNTDKEIKECVGGKTRVSENQENDKVDECLKHLRQMKYTVDRLNEALEDFKSRNVPLLESSRELENFHSDCQKTLSCIQILEETKPSEESEAYEKLSELMKIPCLHVIERTNAYRDCLKENSDDEALEQCQLSSIQAKAENLIEASLPKMCSNLIEEIYATMDMMKLKVLGFVNGENSFEDAMNVLKQLTDASENFETCTSRLDVEEHKRAAAVMIAKEVKKIAERGKSEMEKCRKNSKSDLELKQCVHDIPVPPEHD